MELVLTIPDEVAERLENGSNGGQVTRRLLELAAVEGYRSGTLTPTQAQEMLGLDRFEFDGVLKAHGVFHEYTEEELAEEVAAIEKHRAAREAAVAANLVK
ncbi:MAG: UPF0175 family protein [Blastocatellia bacterium]